MDCSVPIRDVTFLVGENSTGKSSFISLYNILHDFSSLNEVDFGVEQYNLGSFNDIVSPSSQNSSHFTIGLTQINNRRKTNKIFSILISYFNNEGLPKPLNFTCISNKSIISVRYIDNSYFYYLDKLGNKNQTQNGKNVFSFIKDVHNRKSKKDFKEFKMQGTVPSEDSFIFFLPTIIASMESQRSRSIDFDLGYQRHLFARPCVWFAPIRTRPRRMYAGTKKKYSSEGEHTPFLLKKILGAEEDAEKFLDRMRKFGQDASLFDDVKIHPYGGESSSPFEVQICFKEDAFSLDNVGYGVSQILPIVVELISREKGTIFNIQQPEVHLHPKAQAALGSLILDLLVTERKRFIIETHSEFIIDRFRSSVREIKDSTKIDASVLFFERRQRENHVTEISILQDGRYNPDQPPEFREFFFEEKLNQLGI